MEFFFADPNVERLPPAETRVLDLRAELDPEGKRLRVSLDLTPFQQRPYIELSLTDSTGNGKTSASIVEPVGWKLEVTLHIRKVTSPTPEAGAEGKIEGIAPAAGPYTLTAILSYPDLGEVDRRSITISGQNQKLK